MEFFEFVLIFSIVFVLPLTILKTVLDYKKSRLAARSSTGEAGVTAGELKRLLKEAVQEANAPLLERLEALEHERLGLPPSGSRDLLADVEDAATDLADSGEEVDKSVGRRVHG